MIKFYLQYMYLTDIIYLGVDRLIIVMISQYQRRSQKAVKKPMTETKSEGRGKSMAEMKSEDRDAVEYIISKR